MKILIDARLYGLEHAGLGRYTLNLLSELTKIDRKNSYVVLLRKNYFDQLKFPKNWTKILADFRHYSLSEQIKLPRIIRSQLPDLVHFLHFNVPLFYPGKFVVTIHDVLMHKQKGLEATTLPFYSYWLKRLGYGLVFKTAATEAEKILVPSATVKKEVKDFYKINDSKVVVTYEGVGNFFFEGKSSNKILNKYKIDKPYFIYAGNAYPHKNLEKAILAVVSLNKTIKEKVIFVIVSGRDFFTRRLEKEVIRMKAGKYVKILPFVTDPELASLYASSAAFVTPSLMEGFGLPGLEAMASGTLTLASDIPVFKEVYKNAAIYFDPNDIASISTAMQAVLKMKATERTKLVKDRRKFARKYSWEKMAEKTLKVYEEFNPDNK